MIKLLSHLDFTRVGHCKSILEDEGIRAFVKNANASGVMGEVPYLEVWPELWLLDPADEGRAREILARFDEALKAPIPPWTCPACAEPVEAGFGECWSCGAPHPDFTPDGE